MTDILDAFDDIVENGLLDVVERIDVPRREERRRPLPAAIMNGPLGRHMRGTIAPDSQAWNHQSLALERHLAGEDVIVTTATASGKSAIFQAAGVHRLAEDQAATALILYPIKALAGDQIAGWQRMLRGAGLPDGLVAEVTGGVNYFERFGILRESRVIIATPDVVHAWLLGNLDHPDIRRFVGNLRLAVLDETHVLESVFGSNVAFMLRRLEAAHALCAARMRREPGYQYVAASATMENAIEHMRTLTGRDFAHVDESQDGSPRQARTIMHAAMPEANAEWGFPDLQASLVSSSSKGSFVTFVDSRMGAERLALAQDRQSVTAYRSGYEAKDRTFIERRLRENRLRGVVSTSALEMGIDFPGLTLGFNLGVPPSRRSLHQRIGRVGRASEGAFAVIAPADEFRSYGESFEQWVNGPVEKCSLYLQNRFLQYAHARCLHHELAAVGVRGRAALPKTIQWPEGFAEAFENAREGKPVPRGFEAIAAIGKAKPQYGYPLRDVAGRDFEIVMNKDKKLGKIGLRSALIETYPGAVYLHMGRAYEVRSWGKSLLGKRSIKVIPTSSRRSTKPIMRTYANFSLEGDGVVDHRLRGSGDQFVAECRLKVVERVEGYTDSDRKEPVFYSRTSLSDPSRSSKQRVFETTGVVIKLGDSFAGVDRSILAGMLVEKLRRSEATAPQDVGIALTDVSMEADGIMARVDDAIVVYDSTYGSLRLTEPLFDRLDEYLGDLRRGMSGTETGKRFAKLHRWLQAAPAVVPDARRDFALQVLGVANPQIEVVAPGQAVDYDEVEGWLVERPLIVMRKGEPVTACKISNAALGRSVLVTLDKLCEEGANPGLERAIWNPFEDEIVDPKDQAKYA